MVFFVLAALAAACGDASPDPAASAVRFTAGPCAVELPAGQRPESVTCGTVTVPARRDRSDGRTVELPVVVLRATGPDPAPDPVVFLSGGPGDAALTGVLANWTASFAATIQERRDIVFFDQRGTGAARPGLGCPEYAPAVQATLAATQPVRADTRQQAEALRVCHDRLVQSGVDLDAYTSSASAADVRDLMHALGYRSWNLRGISYGARLALTALRDVPDGIRSVILDSPVPPQVAFAADLGASFERALGALFAGCARDPGCAAAYPDLAAQLATVVARLDAAPLTITTGDPATSSPVVLTGDRLLLGLREAMYGTDLVPVLPFAIASLAAGDTLLLQQIATSVTGGVDRVAWGVRYAVGCAEETPFVTDAAIAEAARGVDPRLFDLGLASTVELERAVCAFWRTVPLGAIENEPVRSAVPTLVLSGEYDPVTPPAYARLIASTLDTAHVVELPGYAHGVLPRRGPEGDRPACAMGIIAQFLEQPAAAPDTGCVARIPPVRFAGA